MSHRLTCSLGIGLFIAATSLASFSQSGEAGRSYPWQYYWQQSLNSLAAKDYAAFLEGVKKAVAHGPAHHPALMYDLARANSLNGNSAEAVRLLHALAAAGLGSDALENNHFAALRAAAGWGELRAKLEAIKAPVIRGSAAFTISERDLIPESIAYDPKTRRFYIGSLHKAKIVRIDAEGRQRDFAVAGQDELAAVLGMKVDARRRLLWVCNAVLPELKNYDKARDGTAAVHKYDLDTGKLIKKYTLENKPDRHLLNDIVIGDSGDAYITDSLAGSVYVIPAAKDELQPLVQLGRYNYPNGIVLSKDEKRLYVADMEGITVINIGAKTQSKLGHPEIIALTGADGLYLYENSLVAVQNSNPPPQRVMRFFLNEKGDRVERARVVESNHPFYNIPTTGVVVGDSLFYIANSQLDSFDSNRVIYPLNKLSDVVILKTPLDAPPHRSSEKHPSFVESARAADREWCVGT